MPASSEGLFKMRFLIIGAMAVAAFAQPKPAAAVDPNQQLINQYCVGCHNQKLKTANLMLDKLDLAHPDKDAVKWERAIRKLRGGMMPPPGMPRPPAARVNALATYLETSLDKSGTGNLNTGNVRIHRLNRTEYANAARDLFGIEVDAAKLLPSDDINGGFDNIAEVLKVSPSFLDQYIMAARAVVKQAIGTPVSQKETKSTLRGLDASVPLPPGARTGVTAKFLAPYEGDYELRAPGNFAVFMVDGSAVETAGKTHLKAGYHEIVAASMSRSFAESEGALFGFIPGAAGTGYASTGTVVGGAVGGGRGGTRERLPA